jgi:hypothetical protein
MTEDNGKPTVKLIGTNGNTMALMSRCHRAVKNLWSKEQWGRFAQEALSDDYDHALQTIQEHFEVE